MSQIPQCCGGLGKLLDTRLFRALGDPTRIGLLAHLVECCKPLTVNEASKCCPIDISVVSRHLAILREAGILCATKSGREVHYAVRFAELIHALRSLADALEACCPTQPTEERGANP